MAKCSMGHRRDGIHQPADRRRISNRRCVARVLNAATTLAPGSLNWSIKDATGSVVALLTTPLGIVAGDLYALPTTDVGKLQPGDYSVAASLVMANQEVERIDTKVRVFDPTSNFQPDQRIVVANGMLSAAGGRPLFLQGVNYWPRYVAGLESARFSEPWIWPQNYDPDIVEADLTNLAALNFNLVAVHYFGIRGARSFIDFLDRCRRHGIWVDITLDTFGGGATPRCCTTGNSSASIPTSPLSSSQRSCRATTASSSTI